MCSEVREIDGQDGYERAARWVLGIYAVAHMLFLALLFINHIRFPLFLDLMEGVVFQHFQRAAAFAPVYPEPTPEYVPLAYNPLYYYVAVPFSWVFGQSLATLRLVSVLGAVVAAGVLFAAVRRHTKSAWWGLVATGLFAAAYRVMDAYLDTAHADACMLASALLGTHLIDRNRHVILTVLGIALLVASFWFKQHGALFALGGLAYVTSRDGWKYSILPWVVFLLLGPALYLFGGKPLFGERFLYFTWEVPRRWGTLDLATVKVLVGFIALNYPFLAVAAVLTTIAALRRAHQRLTIWHYQFAMALLTGTMGALDPGCSFNVFIPMGTLIILMGTIGLAAWWRVSARVRRYKLHAVALAGSFALMAWNPLISYDPRRVIMPSAAREAHADLIDLLRSLDGPVFAPGLGQLPDGFAFHPAAHWVALEDLVRGPGRETRDQPAVRALVAPAVAPAGTAYILTNRPLAERRHFLEFLESRYELQQDFGDRFRALRGLPCRYDHRWPRYLYRYVGSPTATTAPS